MVELEGVRLGVIVTGVVVRVVDLYNRKLIVLMKVMMMVVMVIVESIRPKQRLPLVLSG